ncbi:hypothetical protein PPERSA_04271 [Pseudocohnilembus persalinus]|uniref:B30.2/SPRY domain-containing protein n=1 Tax=Pseudocohnilembus persalinus TaxID=266149 RepID=A0A0V0QN33_PSEPJ|nr:hypothetical protein PPERSA_04271 [Pseudocohnilembus persalinus]|eukprot:KRX03763.1 hypothetical protein PPERSA_04271 [Pseudocohnilembus persalinus]
MISQINDSASKEQDKKTGNNLTEKQENQNDQDQQQQNQDKNVDQALNQEDDKKEIKDDSNLQEQEQKNFEIELLNLKEKIKIFKLPDCQLGELHDQMNQICVDNRCIENNQILTPLCSGCIEDKNHSNLNNHNQRQLKRVLIEILNEVSKDNSYAQQDLPEIQKILQKLASQYETIAQKCLQVKQKLEEQINSLAQKSQEENLIKKMIMEQIKPFLFSEILRPTSIQITNGKIAKQLENQFNFGRVALIEPEIPTYKKTFFAFQIIQQNGWIGLGLGWKNQILKNNFGFSFQQFDHGQYLISSNGYKWINNNEESSGHQIPFQFSQYDIILGEYDPKIKRIRFKKKGSDKMAVVQINDSYEEDDQLMLCVNLSEKNDAVGIFVSNQQNPQE